MFPSMGQIEQFNQWQYLKTFNYVKTNVWYEIELLVLDSNTWNPFTVCKQQIAILETI